jgi:hypothetical protein
MSENLEDKRKAEKKRKIFRGLLLTTLSCIFAGLCWLTWDNLSQNVWAYFTDESGMQVGVEEDKARLVLWEDPLTNPGNAGLEDLAGTRLEATFSPNGTSMIMVRRDDNVSGTDMYLSQWNGRTWSAPEAMKSVNSLSNDRGPSFSRDGKFLYFSSDREGGQGGCDLYIARRQGEGWGTPEPLGLDVNTASDELGPSLSPDGGRLFFSSDRAGKGEDIFVANKVVEKPDPQEEPPAEETVDPFPKFTDAQPVDHLNSEEDDLQVALTSRGDHVFLASDRDRDDKSGFSLYLSRVVDGQELAPEKVDLYFEGGEATDPAVRMDGFDLLFSGSGMGNSEIEGTQSQGKDYRLYRTTTREVFGYTDYSRWDQFMSMLGNIIWWILLAIAALIALIYILEHWRDITNLYHKCLAGSIAIHLIILFLMMIWMITKEFTAGGEPQAPEIAISIDALAQEELALESTPEEAQISETPIALIADQLESDFKIPVLEPQVQTKTTPIITRTSKSSLVSDVRPSKANVETAEEPVTKPDKISPLMTALPETFLPEPETPELEERDPGEPQKAVEPANPEADLFRPTKAVPQVETEKSDEKAEIANKATESTTETDQIEPGDAAAETTDTGGDVIVAHTGLEAKGDPPPLEGAGNIAITSLNLPGTDPETDPLLPGELQTPKDTLDPRALTDLVRKKRDKPSLEVIEQLGGSDATERAIGLALEWLSRHQEPDGRWDTKKHGGGEQYDTASAGLALLCYYGWGVSHQKSGKFQGTVKKALKWLISQQKENGDLRGKGRMYCHGIAAIALCEAYGLSKDPSLREPAEKAIQLIISAQSKNGGWRYNPKPGDSDTSVTGWQYMALHSARMAGIEIEESVFENARLWFDKAAGGKHGGLYGYTGPQGNNQAMTATGMFCRQLDLVPPSDPRMPEGAQALKMRPMSVNNPAYYYVYYGTLALYQHQGPVWADWNDRLKETLPRLQNKNGSDAGSWDKGAGHAATGGRVISTTLATLSLEVYYRLLPMYGFRNKEAAPPPKQKL